jgi:hypothetical protein
MSILKQNKNQDEDAYFNFINSLKSEVTKKEYEREIKLKIPVVKILLYEEIKKFEGL